MPEKTPGLTVLLLHGYGSDPDGARPMYLQEHGYQVSHPALPNEDFLESVSIAQVAFDESNPDVVVGSSRGGAVAMNIDSREVPVVLVARLGRSGVKRSRSRLGR